MINQWQTSNVGSCGKLQRGDESSSAVERSLLKGERDRDFGSVSLSQHVTQKEFFLKGGIFTNISKKKLHELFKVDVQLREDYLRLKLKWTEEVGK